MPTFQESKNNFLFGKRKNAYLNWLRAGRPGGKFPGTYAEGGKVQTGRVPKPPASKNPIRPSGVKNTAQYVAQLKDRAKNKGKKKGK